MKAPPRGRNRLFLTWVPILWLACACGGETRSDPPFAAGSGSEPARPVAAVDRITDREGFVVWESNRTGRWRLWRRELAGGEPQQLTSGDGPRLHCCPHISPDGEWIAYLDLPGDQKGYPRGGAIGAMMLMRPDGSESRRILPSARTYFENRAAVWRSPTQLVFITAEGTTHELDLDSGETRPLTKQPRTDYPWLIGPALQWATAGDATFAPYDAAARRVVPRASLEGCQPYFTSDGEFGYWVAAPGGPVRWIRLADQQTGTLLKKSDSRIPADRGYLYFPMISSDRRLLAYGASNDEHSHLEADYDIFVAELAVDQPRVLDSIQRITDHPATDRFPDVYQRPLELGSHHGEAPYRWQFEIPDTGEREYEWSYGDGTNSRGAAADHIYEQPGRYRVTATSTTTELRGLIEVRAASPPRPISTRTFEDGSLIEVRFDEPISIDGLQATLESGVEVVEARIGADETTLQLLLASALRSADRLELSGVEDRAREPNRLGPTAIEIEPPRWPSDDRGLVFVWSTGNSPNLLFDPGLEAETASTLDPKGLARLGHHYELAPSGGSFGADEASTHRLLNGCQLTNEISIELTLTPPATADSGRSVVVTASGKGWTNFALAESGGRFIFEIRKGGKGPAGVARVDLFELPRSVPSHVVVTFSSGRLRAYVDGQLTRSDDSIQGGFFHWRARPLTVGADGSGRHPWRGKAEGIAVYNRVLEPAEVAENSLRYANLIRSRPPIETFEVTATLTECSRRPTLEEIAPYREALIACAHRIEESDGEPAPGSMVRVARWAILDGRNLELPEPGVSEGLRLTRFRDNPQLESDVLSDTLDELRQSPLFYVSLPKR